MNTQFHVRGLRFSAESRRRLERSLGQLEGHVSVTAAAVVLEHRPEDPPAFRAFVALAVPGPDIHVEARDHTLEAAWLKVTTLLRKQIEQRRDRREARAKENGTARSLVTWRTNSAKDVRTRVSRR